MNHKPVKFVEGTLVEKEVDPLPSGELSLFVLGPDTLRAAAEKGGRVFFLENLAAGKFLLLFLAGHRVHNGFHPFRPG